MTSRIDLRGVWATCGSATLLAACLFFALPAAAQVPVEVVHDFVPQPWRSGGGLHPGAGVVQGPDGTFYGTATLGGKHGKGTVYRVGPDGQTQVIHSFDGRHGANPRAELTVGPDGLYGSTQGTYENKTKASVLFKIDPSGRYTPLHTFQPNTEGSRPGALLLARDGNFYGTLEKGANNIFDKSGALFRMTPSGEVTILHRFKPNGISGPSGVLIQGLDGSLYGTTAGNVDSGVSYTSGAVYRYDMDGTFTVLYRFLGDARQTHGDDPVGLVQTPDGVLYGLTSGGGANNGGTMYRINPDGSGFAIVTAMPSRNVSSAASQLILGRDGIFYGTETIYRDYGAGRLFQLTPAGGYTLLATLPRDFSAGNALLGRLLQGFDGRLYGVAHDGGRADAGTLYRTAEPVGLPAH